MSEHPQNPDWSLGTWEGSRAEQLRQWSQLSLLEKFKAAESLEQLGRQMIAHRREQGLPYFDPDTGELVPGQAKPQVVAEPPAPYPNTRREPTDTSAID